MAQKQDPLKELRASIEDILNSLGPDHQEKCYSTEELSQMLGMSTKRVQRILRQAATLGWLERIPRTFLSLAGRQVTTTGYRITKK